MQITPLHSQFIMPTKSTNGAGGFDIYMPEDGNVSGMDIIIPLGFAAAVPLNHVALLLPRSGVGVKHGVELNNTCGVIDSDYRGEWMAALRTKDQRSFFWKAGDRVLQFIVVPVAQIELVQVNNLDTTSRGSGGFGSTGH